MKTISLTKGYRTLQRAIAVATIATIGLTSCSKDSKTEEVIDGEEVVGTGAAALTFNAAGIEENQIISASGSGMAAKSATALLEEQEWQQAGDFDAQVAFSPVSTVKTDIQSASGSEGKVASANGMKANTLMSNGKKYYLVIRAKGTGAIVYHGDHIAGTKKTVRVTPDVEYEWFAYSINESAVPGFDATSGKVAKAGLANKDVLYAKGKIIPVAGDNLMNITFKRNTVKYNVKLNVRGLFAQIAPTSQISLTKAGATGFDGVAMTGDLNVYDGTYSALERSYALASTFVNADANAYGAAVQEGVVYSVVAQPIAANTFAVGLPKLDLIMRDRGEVNGVENSELRRTHTPANIKMQHNVFTPKLGYEYDVSARLIESAVRAKSSDAWWGRTNLTYREGHPDKYIFKADNNAGVDINNDFWGWKTRTPKGKSYGEVDPCSLVYPAGTWKMPTGQQGEALGKVKLSNKKENYALIWGAVFASGYDIDPAYNSVNTSYPELSRNLYFTMYGYRALKGQGFLEVADGSLKVYDDPKGLLLGVLGSGAGYYWTDSRVGTTNKARALKWEFNRLALLVTWSDYAEVEELDMQYDTFYLQGLTRVNVSENQGANVRCVRVNAPTGS